MKKRIFIFIIILLFTTMLFSILINRAEIIKNENDDQDETFVVSTFPETMSTAEFSFMKDIIIESNKSLIETFVVSDYQNNTDIEIQNYLTGTYFEQSQRGSVSPTEFYSLSSQDNRTLRTLLSAGALKIPHQEINYIVNEKAEKINEDNANNIDVVCCRLNGNVKVEMIL